MSSASKLGLYNFVDRPTRFFSRNSITVGPVCRKAKLGVGAFRSVSFSGIAVMRPRDAHNVFSGGGTPLFRSRGTRS